PSRQTTIEMPGEWGGANWGAAAVNPQAGMLYVRASNAPTTKTLTDRPVLATLPDATPPQQGHLLFNQLCIGCHAPEGVGAIAPKLVGLEAFKRQVANGGGQMPGFHDIPAAQLETLIAYLNDPPSGALPPVGAFSGGGQADRVQRDPGQNRYYGS